MTWKFLVELYVIDHRQAPAVVYCAFSAIRVHFRHVRVK